MAVVGHGGKLWLRREAPEALVLGTEALHLNSNSLLIKSEDYWSGDEVTLTGARGLPVALQEGLPACPEGYGVYEGSIWPLGANRAHLNGDQGAFYAADDEAPFYLTEADTGLQTSASFFIYKDQLDRASFYTTQAAALRGRKEDRVSLYRVDFGSLILAPYGTEDYQNALLECSSELDQGDYRFSDVQDEVTLASICDFAPRYQQPVAGSGDYANAEIEPRSEIDSPPDRGLWTIQGLLSNWTLNLSAREIDTTSLGEKFGDAVKSIITGGGTVDFLVAREDRTQIGGIPQVDSTSLLRLLLLTEHGCKADCQFWMVEDQRDALHLLPGDLYYETKMLVTEAAINTRAAEYIAGTMTFYTVGRIDLKMGTN